MSVADWVRIYETQVRPTFAWLPDAVFVERKDGVNAANKLGLVPVNVGPPLLGPNFVMVTGPAGAFATAVPTSPVDADFVAHEAGHGAHDVASAQRDAVERKGTAAEDIAREVAAIVSHGADWSADRLRFEYMAEAFRKAVTGNVTQERYPVPPGQISPYPLAALRAYFATMHVPRVVASPPPPPPVAAALPAIADVYYSQYDPDHIGTGDCVPTSAKMLIELYTGRVVPIADIRSAMDLGDDGVINLARDSGITLEAARAALTNDYGIPSTAVFAHDLDVDQLLGYVRAGRLPIAFELHGDLSDRMDQGFRGLHAVLVISVDGDQAEIKDPDRWGANRAERWTVPLGEFRRAWEDGAALGGGAVIPNEPRGGEMDRKTFDEWFREQYMAVVDPTIVAMKNAYDPLIVAARDNHLLDAAQEAAIAAALARLDKLRDI